MAKKKKKEKEPVAEGEEAPPPSKAKGIIVNAVVFLLITGIAAGAGFGASTFLEPASPSLAQAEEHKDGSKDGDEEHADKEKDDNGGSKKPAKDGDGKEEEEGSHLTGYAKPLAPILTNLASPQDTWVRMEVALVTEGDATEELLEEVHQDLLTYMRTVKLHHVEGPSGYSNLKAQLNDRAKIRSDGEVKRVLIRTMLFE